MPGFFQQHATDHSLHSLVAEQCQTIVLDTTCINQTNGFSVQKINTDIRIRQLYKYIKNSKKINKNFRLVQKISQIGLLLQNNNLKEFTKG